MLVKMCASLNNVDSCRHWFATTSSGNIFNFRINASKQPQSILRRLFRCMLDVVMMTKLHTYECKTLPVNNFVLFTVRVCTDLIHWLLHLCCRNWGLPSLQNWFREGSQGANDTWNDYYEKEIKCLLSIQQWNKLVYNLFSSIRPGPESRKESNCGGNFDSSRYERLLDTKIDKLQWEMRWLEALFGKTGC